MSNFFSKPEISILSRMSYTMTWFCSDLNYMPSIFSSLNLDFCLQSLTHVEQVFDLPKGMAIAFPFAHKHDFHLSPFPLHLFRSLFPLDKVCVSVFFLSHGPGGTYSSLPLHHLIIIHLGGRISTAWDIKPITQSWQVYQPTQLSSCSHTAVKFTGRKSVLNASC